MNMIGNDWDIILQDQYSKDYFIKLNNYIDKEYLNKQIFPKKDEIYNAFKLCSYQDVKVVIIGQDPYHDINQAHGLCFSVKEGVKLPPSLKNIYKELSSDLKIPMPLTGDLTKWAKEGVLLLNTILTVEAHKPKSHANIGWEVFTDNVIKKINEKQSPVIFVLWGNDAKAKEKLITNDLHCVLKAAHPSPLSCYNGFFGCKHFSKINEILRKNNMKEIDWSLK